MHVLICAQNLLDKSDGFNRIEPYFGEISLTGDGDWKRRFILHFSFDDGVGGPALQRFHCDGGKLQMKQIKSFIFVCSKSHVRCKFDLLFTLLQRIILQRCKPLMNVRIGFIIYFNVVQCLENIVIHFRWLLAVYSVSN